MLLVHDFLERSAERNPGKIALIFDGQQLTYAEINGMTDRLAAAFSRHGVVRGDRIVLFLPNSVELVVGIFAALKANAVFVVLNDTMKADKLFRVLANCRAAALLTSSRHARLAGEAKARIPSLKFSVLAKSTVGQDEKVDSSLLDFDALQAEFTATPPHRQCIDQDLACLIYTSGSSGEPKGVMSTHANVVFAAGSIISFLHNVPEDIVICALPLSFDYGLYQLLMTFKFGGTLVLERSFVYAGQFLQRLETEKVTGLPGVPTIFSILLRMDLSSYDLHHIRYITNTAASLPIKHIRELAARFPQAAIYSMYEIGRAHV